MKTRWAALLFFILFATTQACACSCAMSGGTCGALKPGGTMFLGEVTGARPVAIPMAFPGRSDLFTRNYVFRIRVIEAFSGGPKAGEEVELRTGGGGGDCGYGFVVGHRYLVDAYDMKPQEEIAALPGVHLGTGICSRTQAEDSAGIALKELRAEIARQRQPDLHGSVRTQDARSMNAGRPLPGIVVSLTAERDGAVYRAVTEADGIYTFAVLPPGAYRPDFALPAQQKLITYNDSKPLRVVIPANDGTGLACHLDVLSGPTGGVRGRVIDGSGRPIAGSVSAHRVGPAHSDDSFGSEWSDRGEFKLDYLPDGDYTIDFMNYATHLRGSAPASVREGTVTEDVVITATHSTP